jgi:hypothetical protein
MIASLRTARTSSGRISGTGFASANTIGFGAILAIISPVTAPATERPTKTSASSSAWEMVRFGVSTRKRALYGSISPFRPLKMTPWRSHMKMFSRFTPSRT